MPSLAVLRARLLNARNQSPVMQERLEGAEQTTLDGHAITAVP